MSNKMNAAIDNLEKEEEISLSDMFDINFLQKFQDTFSNAVGLSSVIADKDGVQITKGSNFCEFCMKHNRMNKKGLVRCMQSDAYGGNLSARTGKAAVYACSNGLMDFAAPIVLNGKQIGSFLGGQVLTSAPDFEKFKKIAKEIDADPDDYVAALKEVKIVPEEQVRAAADFLFLIAAQLSKMSYQWYSIIKMSSDVYQNIVQIQRITQELRDSSVNVTQNHELLNQEVQNVQMLAKFINEVSEAIIKITKETQILGINSKIEATRAKEYGRGMGVVADRINVLSDESREIVNQIQAFLVDINKSLAKTSSLSNMTLEISEQQETGVRDIVDSIEGIMQMTEQLNQLAMEN